MIVTDDTLKKIADTDKYYAILETGQLVDFKPYFYQSLVEEGLNPYDPNLSGFFSKIGKKIKGFVKKAAKVVKKIAPIALIAMGAGFLPIPGGGLLGKVFATKTMTTVTSALTKGNVLQSFIASGGQADPVALIRNSLQQQGVIPTNDMISAGVQYMQQQMQDQAAQYALQQQGQATQVATQQSAFQQQLMAYMPYVLIGGGLLMFLSIIKR